MAILGVIFTKNWPLLKAQTSQKSKLAFTLELDGSSDNRGLYMFRNWEDLWTVKHLCWWNISVEYLKLTLVLVTLGPCQFPSHFPRLPNTVTLPIWLKYTVKMRRLCKVWFHWCGDADISRGVIGKVTYAQSHNSTQISHHWISNSYSSRYNLKFIMEHNRTYVEYIVKIS